MKNLIFTKIVFTGILMFVMTNAAVSNSVAAGLGEL